MGAGHVPRNVINTTLDLLLVFVKVASNGLCKDSDHWPLSAVDFLNESLLFVLRDHVVVRSALFPSLLEVVSACQQGVLKGQDSLHCAEGGGEGRTSHRGFHF